jgi:hypothetical protein
MITKVSNHHSVSTCASKGREGSSIPMRRGGGGLGLDFFANVLIERRHTYKNHLNKTF